MKAINFFEFPESLEAFVYFFPLDEVPWSWLPNIEKAMIAYGENVAKRRDGLWRKYYGKLRSLGKAVRIGQNVYFGEDVRLPNFCTIEDNVYIGDGTEIRSGALIRKNVIIGKHCVIGNSCEIKNSLLMDRVQVSHLNYVGDSILGTRAHLSAGAVLSNLRFDNASIAVKALGTEVNTGLRKFGAIMGDGSQIGCNSVLLPGTVLGKNATVSVGTVFGGVLPANQTVYTEFKQVKIEKV